MGCRLVSIITIMLALALLTFSFIIALHFIESIAMPEPIKSDVKRLLLFMYIMLAVTTAIAVFTWIPCTNE